MTATPRTHTHTFRTMKSTAKVVACLTVVPTAVLAGAVIVPSIIAAAM